MPEKKYRTTPLGNLHIELKKAIEEKLKSYQQVELSEKQISRISWDAVDLITSEVRKIQSERICE